MHHDARGSISHTIDLKAARSTARASTASSICAVRRPVNVFCWLGWNVPRSVHGPDRDLGGMAEPGQRARQRTVHCLDRAEGRGPAERAERHDHSSVRQQVQLALEEWSASIALRWRGCVGGRRASDGRRHVGATKLEAVVAPGRRRLAGEARPVERREEEVARTVAREHPPGPIATVGRRCQPDEHDPGRRIAEARQRPRPVPFATEPRRWIGSRLFAPRDESRARPAGGDLDGEHLERRRGRGRLDVRVVHARAW